MAATNAANTKRPVASNGLTVAERRRVKLPETASRLFDGRTDQAMTGVVEPESRFLSELGQRVRDARTLRGLSRKLLSQSSGLSERYIAQLESGRGNVSIILLRRVANAMGVRLDDLIVGPEGSPDWCVIRDLLAQASPAQVAEVKTLLTGPAHHDDPTASKRVALVGFRGAGKSTLGRACAGRLGWDFVELNAEIERENGLSVREIFAIYGQDGYRRLEQRALRRLTDHSGPLILATGGGIVAEPLTYDLLLRSFHVIWLQAGSEELLQRVREQDRMAAPGDQEATLSELRTVLASREPLYARAAETVDTSGVSLDVMLARLIAAVEARFGECGTQAFARRRSA